LNIPAKITLLLLAVLSIMLYSCNTTESNEDEDNIVPGKRNYTWNIDSVDYGSLPGLIELSSIWGSSPDDVWGAAFTADVRNCLWHYDGQKWSRAVWNTPITEYGNGSKSAGGVWGFSKDDVWVFGGRIYSSTETTAPFIMHYDGSKWTEVTGDVSQMPNGYTDIYPISKNHFWISSSGHVCEYKDGIWKKYNMRDDYYIQSICGLENDIYVTAYPIGKDSLYLMKLVGSDFVIIDQSSLYHDPKFSVNGLLFADSKVYTFGLGLFIAEVKNKSIDTSTWEKVINLPAGGIRKAFKISTKDIWAVGYPGIIYQYNGENWERIFIEGQDADAMYDAVWGDGSEIFICDIENGIVFHGK
jgi:hypothetical protein